jgi:Fe-S-cluster containining protein
LSGGSAAEWYAGGLRFSCTQCGNCCTGPPGTVWVTDDEAAAIAGSLGIELAEFLKQYAKKVDGRWSLKEILVGDGYDCIFLDRSPSGATGCSIYRDRPTQCRTWPFWPENLTSQRTWQAAKRRTPCPGMDDGTLVPIERIRILCDER